MRNATVQLMKNIASGTRLEASVEPLGHELLDEPLEAHRMRIAVDSRPFWKRNRLTPDLRKVGTLEAVDEVLQAPEESSDVVCSDFPDLATRETPEGVAKGTDGAEGVAEGASTARLPRLGHEPLGKDLGIKGKTRGSAWAADDRVEAPARPGVDELLGAAAHPHLLVAAVDEGGVGAFLEGEEMEDPDPRHRLQTSRPASLARWPRSRSGGREWPLGSCCCLWRQL